MLDETLPVVARFLLCHLGGVAPVADVADAMAEELALQAVDLDLDVPALHDLIRDAALRDGPMIPVGDLLVDIPTVVDGFSLAHRLTVDEVDHDTLDLDPDLAPLARVASSDGGLHRIDGTRLDLQTRRVHGQGRGGNVLVSRHLAGPEGWLAGFAAGAMVAVSATEGYLSIKVVDEPADGSVTTAADAVREHLWMAFETANGGDGSPVFMEEVLVAALVGNWYLPRVAAPPFGAVAEAAGFEIDGCSLGAPGGWEKQARIAAIVAVISRHVDHLEPDLSSPLLGFLAAFDAWRADESIAPDRGLLSRLGRAPDVAHCLAEELVRSDPDGVDLNRFLDAFGAGGPNAAVLDTFRSLASDLRGDAVTAEALIDAALAASPGWLPALDRRIEFLDVRGREQEVVNLLQRTRQPGDTELEVARRRARQANAAVGRNDPCPCGSGRKFKQCHLGRDTLAPSTRVTWLIDKARTHLVNFSPRLLDDLDGPNDHPTSDAAYLVTLDVALFDRAGMDQFLRSRRALLPEPEVALLEAWRAGHRSSVYRVESISDDTVTVTDQAGAGSFLVHRTPAWDESAPHDLVWCRLLPGDERWWISGMVLSVRLAERDTLIAAIGSGPVEHVRTMLRNHRSPWPQPTASDGQPLVDAEATWSLTADGPDVERALGQIAQRQDHSWSVSDGDGVAVTLTVSEGRLTARTTSAARHHRAVLLVEENVPGASERNESVVPMARRHTLDEDRDTFDGIGIGADEDQDAGREDDEWEDDEWEDRPDNSAALTEAIERITAGLEDDWVTKPWPALGGRSATDAARDPELVDDVHTMLREVERRDVGMSADRLRRRLGLT